MLRKAILAIAAVAALGSVALIPNNASARGRGGGHIAFRGGGFRGGGFRGWHGGRGWRGGGWGWRGGPRVYGFGAPFAYGYSCWRWSPTAWGPRRVWVC